ncbi:MAG: DUF6382 domain-containing protein [Clostridiales bacterium]
MDYEILNDFNIDIENENNDKYLVFSTNAEKSYLSYQVEMLSNNDTNFLHIKVRRMDNNINFYYDITSKMSIVEYLESFEIDKVKLLKILKSIVKTLFDCEDLILSDASILLKISYIYIDKKSLDVYFVYMPIEMENNSINLLKDLLTDLISSRIKFRESLDRDCVRRILAMLKSDKFNIVNLSKLLNELEFENDSVKNTENVVNIDNNSGNTGYLSTNNENDLIKNFMEFKVPETFDKSKKESKKINLEGIKINSNIVIGICIQILLFVIASMLMLTGVINSMGNSNETTFAIFAVIIGLLSVLNWRIVLSKSSKKSMAKPDKKRNSFNKTQEYDFAIPGQDANIPSIKSEPKKVKEKKVKEKNIAPFIEPNVKNFGKNEKEFFSKIVIPKNNEENNKTTMIKDHIENKENQLSDLDLKVSKNRKKAKKSYLEYRENGNQLKIIIDKDKFVLGRIPAKTDYSFSSKDISKLHANIFRVNGKCYIRDLQSVNGTYINEVRLKSDIVHKLRHNDVVVLAKTKLKFKENKF